MHGPAALSFTFSDADIWMSEFRLRPDHPVWSRRSVTTSDAILIAIPRTTVGISHEGRAEVIADPMCAVFYAPGQPYRRRLLTAVGDDCTIIAISEELADAAHLPRLRDGELPFTALALGKDEYESAHRARRLAAASGRDSHDAVREEILWLVGRLAGRTRDKHGISNPGVPSSEVVARVRETLGRDGVANRSLGDLARSVNLSPFHLARTFREHTGRPIHRYRTELRLRASLAPISDGVRIADVAQDLGFASHAHLTDRFRREFGTSPEGWRAALRSRPAQNSKIVEA